MRDMLRSRGTFGKLKTAIFFSVITKSRLWVFLICDGKAFVGRLGVVVEAAEESTMNDLERVKAESSLDLKRRSALMLLMTPSLGQKFVCA